ncbi:MAG: BON domain-containing protein [Candidatus Pelagibacterales bacterium]|tara:strand:- start:64 stop:651 length:588 start_codon:yes stop_codon:yes gene_type:complete
MLKIFFSLSLLLIFTGCAQVAVGGISKSVLVAKEERSVGTFIDDTVIAARLKNLYFNQNEKIFFNVDVEVNEGRVLLTGTVETSDIRIEATKLAWGITDVVTVINEIQISENDNILDYADDLVITTKINAKLLINKEINNLNYNIDTVNKIVYVIGIAQNKNELANVIDIINSVYGVQEVINYVRLKEDTIQNAG